jgi:hypothetical protein
MTTDRSAARVKRAMDQVRARRAAGRDIPAVPRVRELDQAITDMGCDPNDPEQFLAAATILLNAHFKPRYTPIKKGPEWTNRLHALLLEDVRDEIKRNPKLGIDSACKKLLKRGRKKGEGLWRGMYQTGAESLRKRYKFAENSVEVQEYILETLEKRLAADRKFIDECEARRGGEPLKLGDMPIKYTSRLMPE